MKLLRTLLVAGVILILFHELISHWSDFKAGLSDGFKAGAAASR